MATKYYGDVVMLIRGLDSWSMQDENLAMLVDRLDYWLQSEYSAWITDPNDPEVQRARRGRMRRGDKPPPRPVIVPVAQRPARILAPMLEEIAGKPENKQSRTGDSRRWGSISDVRKAREG